MVGNDASLSGLQVIVLDLRNKGGGQSGELGNFPAIPVVLPPAPDGGDVFLAVARFEPWTATFGSVGTRDLGADGGWNRPEGLGCFVFCGHGGLEVFHLELAGGVNHHPKFQRESEHGRKVCVALEIVDPPCRIRFGFEVVASLGFDEFEARRGEAEGPLGLQRCGEFFADLGGPFDLFFGSCECVHFLVG